MNRRTENKIILVTRPTRWMELMARHGTPGQAKFFLQSRRLDSETYEMESARFDQAFRTAMMELGRLGRVQSVMRDHLPNFLFGPEDVVVVLGQDGLVANTLKYTDGQPVIGVNPDPDRHDGILLPFTIDDLQHVIPEVFAGRRMLKSVTMAEARMNDGRLLRAVNDLFIGPKSHISARYEIRAGQRTENQSSSGVIVSTGMGSTGWFRSLLAGATGMVEEYGYGKARIAQREMPAAPRRPPPSVSLASRVRRRAGADEKRESAYQVAASLLEPMQSVTPPVVPKFDGSFPWDARYLYFTVREPFPTRTTGVSIVFGRVTPDEPLHLTSQMPEHGVIFSDGIEADFLEFNSGDIASIGLSERTGRLVI